MRAVGEVQVPSDDIIDVVAMRDGLVAAAGAVAMPAFMSVAGM
jgi:hypothetical protein